MSTLFQWTPISRVVTPHYQKILITVLSYHFYATFAKTFIYIIDFYCRYDNI